jgi:hypothetical protein
MFNPWLLLGALVAALAIFMAGHRIGVKNTSLNYENAIKSQKLEAAKILAEKVQENAELAAKWTAYARKADDDYTKSIADVRNRANVATGVRFYDPGRRDGCSGTPTATQGSPAAPESPSSESGRISDEAAKFLREQAALADEVTVYALSCFAFVNH